MHALHQQLRVAQVSGGERPDCGCESLRVEVAQPAAHRRFRHRVEKRLRTHTHLRERPHRVREVLRREGTQPAAHRHTSATALNSASARTHAVANAQVVFASSCGLKS
eukprot:4032820-Prymnesium_polylepis.1